MMLNDGDDENGQPQKKDQNGPVEPGEIQAPPGVDAILGSEQEKKENKKFL